MTSTPLGIKRHCQACGKNFYDLSKDPIICPYCQAAFDPEILLKSTRVKMPTQQAAKKTQPDDDKDIDQNIEENLDEVEDEVDNDEDILDDDSDIVAITSNDRDKDEEMQGSNTDEAIEDELDAPTIDDEDDE